MPDSLPRLKAALDGRYRIEQELGRGGMSAVYLAEDVRHDRHVAIKVFGAELSAALEPERFRREVQIAARLNHPHILALYDSGNADGFLYYVMPYVEGESLRARLQREHQLPVEDALSIARQVASALDYAHARRIIHRDVKPENILLHEGEAMVADFGIALLTGAKPGERITQTGLVVGTPEYMSPEQALGETPIDARTDVYSLGCVLYEMLAGEPPYTGTTAQALIAKRLVDPVPAVRRLRSTVPPAVELALIKALAKSAVDRFASAGAFAEALSTPVHATSPAVAVLPFVNLSADPENEFFADGITEDVIAHLSKVRALRVISRTSVMQFRKTERTLKEIAATLGATTLLEGSVRRAGDRVRIVAQLIDAGTDQHLWADTYDRQVTDIFAIQTDVALHIAEALKAELSVDERVRIRKEPTTDLEAYRLYLYGRNTLVKYTADALREAISFFERAIARDPAYALAFVGIAMAYLELIGSGAMAAHAGYPLAREAVASALRLDPTLGDAHCTAAYLRMIDLDWSGAEGEFKRALELSPGSADVHDLYGRLCAATERYEEALALQQRAHELDPLAHRVDVATTLLRAGRYEEAAESAAHAVELEPGLDRAHATLGWAELKCGRVDAGLAELERAVALSPADTQWLAQLGQAYALTGREDAARAILHRLEARARTGYVSPYHLVFVYTGLGEHERALDLLERAVREREGAVYGIKGSFLLAPLRAHPRFTALLRELGLAPEPPRRT